MSVHSILSRPYGPLSSTEDLWAIHETARKEFQQDSADFVEPYLKSLPEEQKLAALETLLTIWAQENCPLQSGEVLTAHPLFEKTDMEQLLGDTSTPTLGFAFLKKRFHVYNLLKRHPNSDLITADRIVEAINYAWVMSYNNQFKQTLVNALISLLSPGLLKTVREHNKLNDLVKLGLHTALIPWRLFLTALSSADYEKNRADCSLNKLVKNNLFEPKVFKIVRLFLP